MKEIMKKYCILFAILAFTAVNAHTQNGVSGEWTQYRGNNRDGKSQPSKITGNWPETGPKLAWKKKIGNGFSEVIISGNQCFTMYSEEIDSTEGYEYAVCYNIENGEELWKTKLDTIFIDVDGWGNGPRATTTVDDDKLYCISACGKLAAISKENGEISWEKNFQEEYKSSVPRWGFSNSPIIVDSMLITEAGGKDGKAFVAINKKNGETLWAKGNGGSTYCSPIVADIDGKQQIIFANGSTMYSFNTKGDTNWTFKMPLRSPTALPLLFNKNKIFVSSVSATGGFVVEVKDGKPAQIMKSNSMKNHWSTSSFHDGHFYGFNVASLRCITADSGQVKWSKRGLGKGSLIMVNDKLLILTDKGKIVLAEASPEGYKEINSFQAIEGRSWTAPSFANGRVFVRNHEEIACYILNGDV